MMTLDTSPPVYPVGALWESRRVFIDTDTTSVSASLVTEYSLRQHMSQSVRVSWLAQRGCCGWRDTLACGQGGTSGQARMRLRSLIFALPALMMFQGQVLYVTGGVIATGRLDNLWTLRRAEPVLMRLHSFETEDVSAVLLDCERCLLVPWWPRQPSDFSGFKPDHGFDRLRAEGRIGNLDEPLRPLRSVDKQAVKIVERNVQGRHNAGATASSLYWRLYAHALEKELRDRLGLWSCSSAA